jgi:hypothetical protein
VAEPTDIARRFYEALFSMPIDPGGFTVDDVWAYMPRLVEFARENRPLPSLCVTLLGELALAGGLKTGATLPDVLVGIERAFGPNQLSSDDLLLLARYLREQRNGGFSSGAPRKGPSIRGMY